MSVDAHVWLFADLNLEFTEGSSFIDPEPNTERTNKNLHTHGLLQLVKMVIDSKIGTNSTVTVKYLCKRKFSTGMWAKS